VRLNNTFSVFYKLNINNMSINSFLYKTLLKLPYFGNKLKILDNCGYLPGHYYSPIPDLEDIRKRSATIFKKTDIEVKGINLRKEEQFALLQQFTSYYRDIPYDFKNGQQTSSRYQSAGAWYRYSDVVMLYSMMRHFKPANIIEIGSGYSSAIMLDIDEQFLNSKASINFIEPYPERLLSLISESDKKKHKIIRTILQDVPLDIFRNLERNDILFIDSSHVSKAGSDLNHILFEILPILKSGVIIHFHDIYYPFEMPESWILDRLWYWNENYILRAFLTENSAYDIINFNSYLHKEFKEWFSENMPVCLMDVENTGSIWIRKN